MYLTFFVEHVDTLVLTAVMTLIRYLNFNDHMTFYMVYYVMLKNAHMGRSIDYKSYIKFVALKQHWVTILCLEP